MPAADPGTGHYPATVFRSAKGGATVTSSCSCGWTSLASSHAHSVSLFRTHHIEAVGKEPPAPTQPTRRTR